MIASGRKPHLGEERPEPLGLELALLAQGPRGIVAGPRLRVAGIGVAQEVELESAAVDRSAHASRVARKPAIRPRRSTSVAR